MRSRPFVIAVLLGGLLLAACAPPAAELGTPAVPAVEVPHDDDASPPAGGDEDAPETGDDGADDGAPETGDDGTDEGAAGADAGPPAADDGPAEPPATPSSDDGADERPAAATHGRPGRIAVSADGNIHDTDDWGATAATLAILDAAGRGDDLVHYDYSSHVGASSDDGEHQMTESALGGARRYDYDTSVFFDDTKDLDGSVDNIAAAVNASTADDPLHFIVAGPMEVAYRGIAAADADARRFVTVVSHSKWNNDHTHGAELSHTADDVKALGVQFEQLPDQNSRLRASADRPGYERFEQTDDPDTAWIVERDRKRDISDAGMAYWLVTGNPRPTMDDLTTLLTSG